MEKDQIAHLGCQRNPLHRNLRDPNAKNDDYPALYIANALLNVGLNQDTQLKELIGMVHSSVDIVTPEQTYLQISASIKPETDINKVKERIQVLINRLMKPENNFQVVMAAPIPFHAIQFTDGYRCDEAI